MIRWFEKNKEVSWIITIGIAVIIFYLSTIGGPSIQDQPGTSILSIIYHIMAFFFFSLFLNISITQGKKFDFLIISIFLAIFYGITDEFHQMFVQGRDGGLYDIFLDNVGILFSSLFYYFRLRRN